MPRPTRRLAPPLALFAVAAVTVFAADRTLAAGPWGGDTVIFEVVADGADVEFECARGRIDKAITLDGKGDFDLPGTFGAEGRGPARDGDRAAANARYRGHVEGDTMALDVTVGDRQMGPFTLTRDRRPVLKKCR
jgi:hypothetical protein